jgi:protein phosphatase
MGGHNAGEVASSQAVRLLWKQYYSGFGLKADKSQSADPLGQLSEVFHGIHEEIKTLSRSKFEYRGMGTTLTAAVLKEGTLFWAHIGDSRLYRISDLEGIQQLTEDHTLTAKGIREGLLSPEDLAKDHKGALYQAIAVSPQLNVEVGQWKLSSPAWILLCSDGLTDVLDEKTIERVCRGEAFTDKTRRTSLNSQANASPLQICEELIKAADDIGQEDDITVLTIKTE